MYLSPQQHTIIFDIILFLIVLLLFVKYNFNVPKLNFLENNKFSYPFILLLILFIGFRPVGINGYMDSPMYIDWFESVKRRDVFYLNKDFGYSIYNFCLSFLNTKGFFVITAAFYILIIYFIAKKLFKSNWFVYFIANLTSVFYWNYGVYGIRQGLASNIFLTSFFVKNRYLKLLLQIVAVSFHLSLLLPFIAYYLSELLIRLKWSQHLSKIWLFAIPLSFFFTRYFEKLLSYFFFDNRVIYILVNNPNDSFFSRQSFRWDFVLFSAIFVLYGLFCRLFITRDRLYQTFLNIFIISNTFAILIIEANQVHRFFYLSWFMVPLILYYPFKNSKAENLKNMTFLMLILFLPFFVKDLIRFYN